MSMLLMYNAPLIKLIAYLAPIINNVSIVNLLISQLVTCFLEGPDGFFGLFGDAFAELLLDALL